MKSYAYVVTVPIPRGEAEIDTVFSTDTDPEEVKRSLVNHDGYAANIIVRPESEKDETAIDWNGRKGAPYRNQ